jgi:hypothetical protein
VLCHQNRRAPGSARASVNIPEELQDIKNALEGRKFLEKHVLLCPPGEPTTNGVLSYCLHQISVLAGLPKQALNAIRATAFLLEEVEEEAINETVRSSFDSQITDFTSDMKLLVDDINTKIDTHLKAALAQWKQTTSATKPPMAAPPYGTQLLTNPGSYASVLINPPPHINPRLAAREGIKARQFLMEGGDESGTANLDPQELKMIISKALKGLGAVEGKIRSVTSHRKNEGFLIEVDSDALANWMADPINKVELCSNIGDGVSFRTRAYNVIAFNSLLNLDTEDPKHLAEVNEVNELGINTIKSLCWMKRIAKGHQDKNQHI